MCDQVLPVLQLLQTRKRHLRARDVLLGVLEVLHERRLVPSDALRDVRRRVAEALCLAGLATEQAVEHISSEES